MMLKDTEVAVAVQGFAQSLKRRATDAFMLTCLYPRYTEWLVD